ncbi:hypothetical protein N431DRAFT_481293 [Stipitochalara longipes BDJ]|nr:hypothetical protein N431DRAFT_481293 [Stipitochalara longipes BDJ]
MDPVTAFSLAGTILQFIDSGSKFVGLSWRLYRTGEGPVDLPELMMLTKHLDQVLDGLGSSSSSLSVAQDQKNSRSGGDGLFQLADECKHVGNQLLAILQSVCVSHSRKRDALKAAFQLIWKEDDIRSLQSRLDGFRAQFNLHLLVTLRQYAMENSAKQEKTLQALGIMSQNSSRLEGIASSIVGFLASKSTFSDLSEMKTSLRNDLVAEIYQENAQSTKSTAQLIPLAPKRRQKLQKQVLSTLRYTGMEDREGRIAEAYESTFQWVFRNDEQEAQKWYSLRSWLESEDQIYWITGKPGSGKSTLMRYICQVVPQEPKASSSNYELNLDARQPEPRCQPYLRKWAGGKKLFIASFYFWNSGMQLQMTRAGLLRSLLYQILRGYPELIPAVAPSRWESLSLLDFNPDAWKESELESTLDLAVKSVTTDGKLCLIIDGLDEFDGAHDSLVKFVKSLAHLNSNVKFCISSRPWVVFQDAFETKPHLRIETLTYNDIKHYVSSNLSLDPGFSKLQMLQPDFASQLIDSIISKAAGVFLWVNLVVASLLAGMSYGDRIPDLQRRLDLLPPDLEELYDKLLRSLDPFYLEHATQLLLIMETSKNPLPLIIFSFADEESVESVVKMPAHQISTSVMAVRLDGMTRRLNSRWKGLLEIDRALEAAGNLSKHAHQTVQYLHRTVKDFIKTRKVQEFLQSSLKSRFDPHLSLCVGHYAYIKAFPTSVALADEVRVCLWYAARVQAGSEKDMMQMLDDMASTLPARYTIREPRTYTPHRSATTTTSDPEPCRYLGIEWDYERQHGGFGDTFLSLAVIHGVTAYVKARATQGCLVQKPCYNSRSIRWPLLMDAVCTGSLSFEMVECLLSLGADPNYFIDFTPEATPWRMLLMLIRSTHSRRLESVRALPNEYQEVVKAMVVNGANLDSAWKFYVPSFTNRFGSRVEMGSSSVFTDGFFKDLQSLPVQKKARKWTKIWGIIK